jgi:hypothetical protein
MAQTLIRVLVLHRCNYCRADTPFLATVTFIIYNGNRG